MAILTEPPHEAPPNAAAGHCIELFAAAMSMQRASLRAVRGVRGFHSTPAAGANINFSATISKVSNDADRVRLINLQKVHDGALLGVADSAEAIHFTWCPTPRCCRGLCLSQRGVDHLVLLKTHTKNQLFFSCLP